MSDVARSLFAAILAGSLVVATAPARAEGPLPASSASASATPAAPPPPKHESAALMLTGMALTAIGLIAGVTGVVWMAAANNKTLGKCGNATCAPQEQRTAGAAVAIAGGAVLAVGVPIWAYGAQRPLASPAIASGPVIGLSIGGAF